MLVGSIEVDPWQEAARLADLPTELAAAALDGLIRRLPRGRLGPGGDAEDRRSVDRAPAPSLPPRAPARRNPPHLLLVVALGAVLLFSVLANGAPRWDDPGASTALTNGVRSSAQS
jgi:hypothetical protein